VKTENGQDRRQEMRQKVMSSSGAAQIRLPLSSVQYNTIRGVVLSVRVNCP
jgi:hypothetical protein